MLGAGEELYKRHLVADILFRKLRLGETLLGGAPVLPKTEARHANGAGQERVKRITLGSSQNLTDQHQESL